MKAERFGNNVYIDMSVSYAPVTSCDTERIEQWSCLQVFATQTIAESEMSCVKLRFHCGDYEECRPLGYKNPVRTLQRTHYHLRYRAKPVNAM
jgi:hypothetical protein